MISEKNLKTLEKLITIETVTGRQKNQKVAINLIKRSLPKFFKSVTFCNNGYFSELFYSSNKNKFDIIFITHIDVVDGKKELFRLKEKNNKFYGRGVFDMKGPLIAVINSVNEFYKNENGDLSIGLLVTSDEEKGGYNGTGFIFNKNKIKTRIAIVPDGGESLNSLIVEEKGVLCIELSYNGISSHVSEPWEGKNASENLIKITNKIIDQFPVKNKNEWGTTASVVGFNSNSIAMNVVPNFASTKIAFRYIKSDSPEEILDFVKSLDKSLKIKIRAQGDALSVSHKNTLIKNYCDIVKLKTGRPCLFQKYHSACDARFLSSKGIPTIITRPLGGGAHGENEWISVNELNLFSDILTNFLIEFKNL